MKIEQKSIPLKASVNLEVMSPEEEDKIVRASSLESLKSLFPDLRKGNDDLLKVSFNVAVANLVNSNNHGILGKDVENCMESFLHKPFNIEHNNSSIVGHATNYGFTTFGDNELIKKITAKYSKELVPFNMALGGVVYKRADPYYADLLKRSGNKTDYWYGAISASWEVLYDEYVIALGSKKLSDAEILYDDKRVGELTKYLSDEEGGSGFLKDGTPIYRIVTGGLLPAGVGFTFTPAADVKGIEVEDESDESKNGKSFGAEGESGGDEPEAEVFEIRMTLEEKELMVANLKKDFLEEISQNEKKSVSKKRHMKIKDITDITEDALKESTASEIRDFIKDQLAAKDSVFSEVEAAKVTEIEAKAKEVEAKEAELKDSLAKVSELEVKLSEVETKFSEVLAAQEETQKGIAFNERMSALDEQFEVSDDQRQVIAKQIRDLSDEDFASWSVDFSKLVVAKSKESDGKPDKALSNASSSEEIPNSQEQGDEQENSFAKYKESFAKVSFSV